MRPDRLPTRRDRASPHASGAGNPVPPPRRARDRDRGALRLLRARRRVVRERPGPGRRARFVARRDVVRPRPRPPGRVGGKADDPLRRSRGRRRASKQSSRRRSSIDHPLWTARGQGRTGGQILVDQLAVHGADLAFGVPGESYLDVLDALRDSPIRFVTCRHEAGAANMAEAYGKLTGRPGICFVTRGPGATQASVGVHTASQDGTPLILLVGQIPRSDAGREAFQELDYGAGVRLARRNGSRRSTTSSGLPELVARAFRTATSGRPGPVVLAAAGGHARRARRRSPDASAYAPAQASPGVRELAALRRLLAKAERPLAVVGGQPWTQAAGERLARWLEAGSIPVAAAWRCQDYVDNESPCYAGHLGLGSRPGAHGAAPGRRRRCSSWAHGSATSRPAGFATIPPPGAGRTLIHVHPDPRRARPRLRADARHRRVGRPLRGGARRGSSRRRADGELVDAAHAAYRGDARRPAAPGRAST